MINTRHALAATGLVGVFGTGWLLMPERLARLWLLPQTEMFTYMGRRYGAVLIGIGVTVWLARDALNTRARRALMTGTLVALVLTTALSLYGAAALGLNAWPAFAVELLLTAGMMWVMFINRDPDAGP